MDKTVFLVLSILMPRSEPDINHAQRMENFDTCWSAAREYTEHSLTDQMREKGALGIRASCGYLERPSQKN